MEQINLFGGTEQININKKIRLIELFADIGVQAKAFIKGVKRWQE